MQALSQLSYTPTEQKTTELRCWLVAVLSFNVGRIMQELFLAVKAFL